MPVTARVNASVLTTAETIYVAATILYSFGITYATDEEFRQGAKDFFYSCTDKVKKYIEGIAIGAMAVPTFSYKIGAEMYKAISGDVVKYYKTYYDQSGVKVTPSASGHIGFTSDSQFTFNLTKDSEDLYYIQHIFLNKMTITLYDKPLKDNSVFDHWAMQPAESDDNANQQIKDYFSQSTVLVTNISNLALSYYSFNTSTRGSYKSNVYSIYGLGLPTFSRTDGSGQITALGLGVDGNNFYWKYNNQYTIDGVVCYLMQCSDNKLRFVSYDTAFGDEANYNIITLKNYDTNATYDSFDSKQQFFAIACDAAGVAFPSTDYNDEVEGDVYTPGAVPLTQNGVVPDVYNGTSDKTLTVPKSKAGTDVDVNDYGQIRTANPADVISDTTTIDYPDGVPNVDSSGISSKFPFCIPFDIYNLFVGLTAEEAPPKFVIPFKYASFDEVNITIDFSNDNLLIFAKVTRWFVGACFVFGLIMITRKVIGSN
ncbi:MAG: hypothetical protein SOT80_07770 [Candidatus Pseudoruminococcus sp.]|nr:hypothetical protein [Ruminococcus sp.]MDY2783283.1 hypothetical protein [Candidatus Pseudoruminococcus sp.]